MAKGNVSARFADLGKTPKPNSVVLPPDTKVERYRGNSVLISLPSGLVEELDRLVASRRRTHQEARTKAHITDVQIAESEVIAKAKGIQAANAYLRGIQSEAILRLGPTPTRTTICREAVELLLRRDAAEPAKK